MFDFYTSLSVVLLCLYIYIVVCLDFSEHIKMLNPSRFIDTTSISGSSKHVGLLNEERKKNVNEKYSVELMSLNVFFS